MYCGTCLRDGEWLRADDGTLVLVRAAPEALSVVATEDHLALARAAYHLGNRHVPLQITPGDLPRMLGPDYPSCVGIMRPVLHDVLFEAMQEAKVPVRIPV